MRIETERLEWSTIGEHFSLDWEATACVGWLIDCDWLNDKQKFTVMVNATDLSWQRTLCPHVNKGRENSYNTWKNSFVELHAQASMLKLYEASIWSVLLVTWFIFFTMAYNNNYRSPSSAICWKLLIRHKINLIFTQCLSNLIHCRSMINVAGYRKTRKNNWNGINLQGWFLLYYFQNLEKMIF